MNQSFLILKPSKLNKSINFELLENIASEAFMPIAYGEELKLLKMHKNFLVWVLKK